MLTKVQKRRNRRSISKTDDKLRAADKNDTKLIKIITGSIRTTAFNFYDLPCNVHWLAKISIACFLGTYFLQIIAVVMARNDPEKLFECFSVMSFCSMGIFKLISLTNRYQDWSFLLNLVTKTEYEQIHDNREGVGIEYESDDEDNKMSFKRYIIEYTEKFDTTSSILSKIYWFTVFVFVMSPFVEYFLWRLRGVDDIALPHILPGWSPLDRVTFTGYLFTVICEMVAAIYCVFLHFAFDLTAVRIMTFACGQYSLLRDYSERIAGRGLQYNISKRRELRARFRINKCHRIHILSNRAISTLDTLLRTMLGVYFFVATLTLCSVALRLKTEQMSVMQLARLLQYMCGILTQLFLYCSYGNAVLYESSVGMGEGPFCASYWCLSPKLRREVLLLGIGMMQTRRLRAGPFNSLDLPSFVQILRAAYSYYAVLT